MPSESREDFGRKKENLVETGRNIRADAEKEIKVTNKITIKKRNER